MPSDRRGLLERLDEWCRDNGWGAVRLGQEQMPGVNLGRVTATVKGMVAYGDSSNQAINSLADGLAEEGWPDDRSEAEVADA